jgi:hypothetical protein
MTDPLRAAATAPLADALNAMYAALCPDYDADELDAAMWALAEAFGFIAAMVEHPPQADCGFVGPHAFAECGSDVKVLRWERAALAAPAPVALTEPGEGAVAWEMAREACQHKSPVLGLPCDRCVEVAECDLCRVRVAKAALAAVIELVEREG